MFKILDEMCTPTKGSEFSACIDLYAREDVVIGAGETVLVPLGVKIDKNFVFNLPDVLEIKDLHDFAISEQAKNSSVLDRKIKSWKEVATPTIEDFLKTHQLNLHIRSSMSAKHGLVIANGTGIIDLDYPGEIMICIYKPITVADILSLCTSSIVEFFNKKVLGNKDFIKKSYSAKEIKKGDKIAQISLVEHKTCLLGVESQEKRNGGFGSTGK